jgi:hypothetical protein
LRQPLHQIRRLARCFTALPTWAMTRVHTRQDRGASVVETIIIVAGFAVLAGAVLAAVSGKVHAWIAKMP